MARDARRPSRPGVAPGRGKPRPRGTSRAGSPTAKVAAATEVAEASRPSQGSRAWLSGVQVTRRAVALIIVFTLLLFSYVGSLQVYVKQQHDMAAYQEQINEHNAAIASLNDQLGRWQDDNYVRAQARTRLGWVMPGETAYLVIGPDGQPVDGAQQLAGKSAERGNAQMSWWQKLWDSIVTANQPPITEPSARSAPVEAAPSPGSPTSEDRPR